MINAPAYISLLSTVQLQLHNGYRRSTSCVNWSIREYPVDCVSGDNQLHDRAPRTETNYASYTRTARLTAQGLIIAVNLTGNDALLHLLPKALVERALQGEMTHQLGYTQ